MNLADTIWERETMNWLNSASALIIAFHVRALNQISIETQFDKGLVT